MTGDHQPDVPDVGARRRGSRYSRRANPLEREIDVTERRMHRVVVAMALVLLPLAIVPGLLIWAARDEAPIPVVNTVSATTDSPSAAITPISSTIGTDNSNKVPAHWTYKGADKTGIITVPPGTDAGSSLLLTVDENGDPTPPMPLRADAGVTAVAIAVVLVGLVIAAYLAAQNWVRTRCDRRRDAMWDDALTRFFAAD